MPTRPPHLDEGVLQALLDGELSPVERIRARKHLRFCAPCAARSVELRTSAARVAALLDLGRPATDLEDAWQRFAVRSGGRRPIRGPLGGAVIAALIVGLLLGLHSGRSADLVFARSLRSLEALGQLHRVSDVCCADRDGQGPADDGVLTVTVSGRRSPVVILYEDTQHQGQFQPGDAVLRVSTKG